MNEEVMKIVNGMVAKAYTAGYTAGKARRGRTWRDKWLRWLGGGGVLVCLVLMALVVL